MMTLRLDKNQREIIYQNDIVSVYNFNPQNLICMGDSWTITGEATVQLNYPKAYIAPQEVAEDDREMLELKKIPEDKARALVIAYVTDHPGARTSDIIFDLELDDELVIKLLNELKNSDILEARDIE